MYVRFLDAMVQRGQYRRGGLGGMAPVRRRLELLDSLRADMALLPNASSSATHGGVQAGDDLLESSISVGFLKRWRRAQTIAAS